MTFNITGPLPSGTTLLEASAGTGKTYTIAALAVRLVAERDIKITDLLLITFGRHATTELRSRVYDRLGQAVAYLEEREAGLPASAGDDPVDLLLADSPDAGLYARRLRAALSHFNEATIVTTHSFCQSMLQELGVLGDWDPAEIVRDEPQDLIRQCTHDVYIRRYRSSETPPFSPRDALTIGEAVCDSPLPLLPPEPHTREYYEFAVDVRDLYESRKVAEGICTYDDITLRLQRGLTDPDTGSLAIGRLRHRFPVVLVDEFQDTDPFQWQIIEAAFAHPQRTTILIGDPKQSIYGFRGADISAYLQAKDLAQVETLGTNFRSDKGVVDGVVNLFGQAELGGASVTVEPVAAHHVSPRIDGVGHAQVWLRRRDHDDGVDRNTVIAHDMMYVLDRLLSQDVTLLDEPDAPGLQPAGARRVKPSDIVILVRSSAVGASISSTLSQYGYPVAIGGSQSVWKSAMAGEWLSLLRAMADPKQDTIRMAALTSMLGVSLSDLLDPQGTAAADASATIRGLVKQFEHGGVAAVHTTLRVGGLDERLLRESSGERLLSDANQLAELLIASGERTLPGLVSLMEVNGERQAPDAPVRATADDDSIKVMTIHAAKGLEFPIVLLPEVDGSMPRPWQPFQVVRDGVRHLYVGPRATGALRKECLEGSLEEELRLLYVAFTRAKYLAIAWHVQLTSTPRRDDWRRAISELLSHHGQRPFAGVQPVTIPGVSDSHMTAPSPTAFQGSTLGGEEPAQLSAATFSRTIDTTWVRTSYSGITHGLHEAAPLTLDEAADVDVPVEAPATEGLAVASPMAGLPAGAAFGTLVHEAFEHLQWNKPTLHTSATHLATELGALHSLDPDAAQQLGAALEAVATTPLEPLWSGTLSDIPLAHRLPELDFDLPLGDAGAPSTVAELAQLMGRHLDEEDPLHAYPARLGASEAAPTVLNGFLTGSIDGVLRLDDGRFVVVDYKTNRLGGADPEEQLVGNYTPDAMAEAMMQAHYPLQALLYCVA
ncbi:MAG TPA: UvrD-helicase domain-containing protein, partial [Tessaracoccus flavescens]|nr:UvrD-helicase domain-containing protein [Tessaracoccus flavescens]